MDFIKLLIILLSDLSNLSVEQFADITFQSLFKGEVTHLHIVLHMVMSHLA